MTSDWSTCDTHADWLLIGRLKRRGTGQLIKMLGTRRAEPLELGVRGKSKFVRKRAEMKLQMFGNVGKSWELSGGTTTREEMSGFTKNSWT